MMNQGAASLWRDLFTPFANMRTLAKIFVGSATLMFAMTAMATSAVWTFDNALFQDDGGSWGSSIRLVYF